MSTLRDFTVASPRGLPVVLLLDVSGSMAVDGKIDALNVAVAAMLDSLSGEDTSRVDIQLAVIAFGHDTATVVRPLTSATDAEWQPLEAAGNTPMGAALTLAATLVEDRDQIPSRSYVPTIVLVSDGQPNDDWEPPLSRLLASERASMASRFAMAIGADADIAMLERFVGDPHVPVFRADQAQEISRFFRWVTMSVTQRVRSVSPNSVIAMEPPSLDDLDF